MGPQLSFTEPRQREARDIVRGRPGGGEVGRGLCAYDAEEAQKIRGRASAEIEGILGYGGRSEMIHRDDLVVGRE